MPTNVKATPDGYHTVTPVLMVNGAEKLIEFMKRAFEAKEKERVVDPKGNIAHAEVTIGDSIIQLADAVGDWKPIESALLVYVPDADVTYHRALKAGATSLRQPADQFYGDRTGGVKDPFGISWWIATHKEDVPREEMERRAEAQRAAKA